MPDPRWRPPIAVRIIVAGFTAMAATEGLTGCATPDDSGSSSETTYVHCVREDEDGAATTVDDNECENEGHPSYVGGHYFYYMSSTHYSHGTVIYSRRDGTVTGVDPNWHTNRVNPTDTGARSKAGLPSSGKIGGRSFTGGGIGRGGGGAHGSVGGHGGGTGG